MEHTEKQTFNGKVISFIEKSRFVIIFGLLALMVIAIVMGIVVYVKEGKLEEGLTKLDAIEFRFESLDSNSTTYSADQDDIIAEVTDLANSTNGLVQLRAYLFLADVNFERENWSEALDNYIQVYEIDKDAYTAPIALYNSAVSYEELGELDKALEYFSMVEEHEDFSLMSRVLFNKARIEDTRGNYQAAADTYQELNDKFPSTNWARLAKSRLIVLQAENKVE